MTDEPMWWEGRMATFDLETTSPLPEEARIVTASLAFVGGGLETEVHTWLTDPGVEIPEEASAIHGVTTEKAQEEGRPYDVVLDEVCDGLRTAVNECTVLVVFNARYDCTVIDREHRRAFGSGGLAELFGPGALPVFDPFVTDKQLDRYRRGKRTLETQCEHWGVKLDGAHDAEFDAVAAARIAYRMGTRGGIVRRVRNGKEAREKAALEREWAHIRTSAPLLHAAQAGWAAAERDRFAEYLAGRAREKAFAGDEEGAQKDAEDAERVGMERGWPVLELMPHEIERGVA